MMVHGVDIDDPKVWAAVNPGYPHRINDEAILAERLLMTDEDFARERCGVVSIDEADDDGWKVIERLAWAKGLSPSSKIEGKATIALDVSPDRKWSSFVAVGSSTLGGCHVELAGPRLPGQGLTVARAVELATKWDCGIVVAKGSPAWSLVPEIEEAMRRTKPDWSVRSVDTAEHAQACGSMLDAITEGTVHHLGDEVLTAAAKAGEKRAYGDAWLWSRSKSAADISTLVAATLARWVSLLPKTEERETHIW